MAEEPRLLDRNESLVERNDYGAISAEEKQIQELIAQQDARIISALRKGEEISLAWEKEALRLRRLLSDISRRTTPTRDECPRLDPSCIRQDPLPEPPFRAIFDQERPPRSVDSSMGSDRDVEDLR